LSRAGEVALGIIGTILNVIFLIIITLSVTSLSAINPTDIQQVMEDEIMLQYPEVTQEDLANMDLGLIIEIGSTIGWVLVILLLISVILSIIAVVKVSKNKSPKVAGVLFIVAGLLSGILLLAPILFYIAAIMCFVRKTRVSNHEIDPFYQKDVQSTNSQL